MLKSIFHVIPKSIISSQRTGGLWNEKKLPLGGRIGRIVGVGIVMGGPEKKKKKRRIVST